MEFYYDTINISTMFMMKAAAYYFLLIAMAYIADGQESTVPVGVEGNDTVTFIRNYDSQGNYDVGYNENVLTGGATFHRERGYINGTRTGSYGYTTRNGLIRIVTYVADQSGYRAEVLTNEPGVGTSNPSNVTVTKEQEPDPASLAQIPSGYLDPQASGSDVVKNYVLTSAPGNVEKSSLGSAQVSVTSPFAAYQYYV